MTLRPSLPGRRALALPAAQSSLILPGVGHFLLRRWLPGTI